MRSRTSVGTVRTITRAAAATGLSALFAHACSVEGRGDHTFDSKGGTGGASAGGQSFGGGTPNLAGGAGKGTTSQGGKAASAGASGGTSVSGSAAATGGAGSEGGAETGAGRNGDAGDANDAGSAGSGAAAGESASTGGTLGSGGSAGGTPGSGGSGGSVTSGGVAGSAAGGATGSGCSPNPCQNGSACTPGAGTAFSCACGTRFIGPRCEFQKFAGLGMWVTGLSHDGTVAIGQACFGSYATCPPVKVSTSVGAPIALKLPSDAPNGVTISSCVPRAVNGDGSWVGGQCSINVGSGYGGVEWAASSTTGKYVNGRNANEAVSDINGASSDASVIVGSITPFTTTSSGVTQTFRRIPSSGIVPIAPLTSGESSFATAVGNDGLQLIGASGGHPFRWHPSTGIQALTELPSSPPNQDQGYLPKDISANGNVFVGVFATRGGPTALRWSTTAVQSLGLGVANGTNHDGSLLVGATNGACVWDGAGKVTDLLQLIGPTPDATGWTLSEAVAVSDNGKVIVGNGSKGSDYQGWVVRLP